MTLPRVSVVIPVFNGREFVGDAIRSLRAQPIVAEIIVVDDGSTDGTADVVAALGADIVLLRLPHNCGVPVAMNEGVRRAGGDLIGFCDADDVWAPGRLGTEIPLLAANPQSCGVWGRTRITFVSGDNREGIESHLWPPRFSPNLGALLLRRAVFDRVGVFDPSLRHAPDIDFQARLQEAGLKLHRHEDIVLTWRRHETNMTNRQGLDRDYFATAVRKALQRRRSASS